VGNKYKRLVRVIKKDYIKEAWELMAEEEKRKYFYTGIGYIGILLVLVSAIRFLLIDDSIGQFIALLALLCLGSYSRNVESKLPFTPKEKRIFKGIYVGAFLIIFMTGAYFMYS